MEQCPACDCPDVKTLFRATDRLYRTTHKTFLVVECARCRLMRLEPKPDPAELRHYYPEEYWFSPAESAASQWEEQYRRLVLLDHVRFVERALREAGTAGLVLDVGCGGGLFLRLLRERGHQVAGIDFSLDAASVAWKQNAVPAVCGTLSRAPFAPGSCSAITMFHVLEHLYDPVSYLRQAHELLADEGRLIVQVPNAACWQFLIFGENWSGLDVPRHLIDFRAQDLDLLLDQCGFEVLRHKHFSLRDNPAALATSVAPSLDPMARRIRHIPETDRMKLFKDLVYLCLVLSALPFVLFEAACRAGATVIVEARKKR